LGQGSAPETVLARLVTVVARRVAARAALNRAVVTDVKRTPVTDAVRPFLGASLP
jgi:hypothetical protein